MIAVNRTIFGAVGIRVSYALLSLVSAIIAARLLGVREFGYYSLWLSIAAVAVLPATAGLPQMLVRETARHLVRLDYQQIKAFWSWSKSVSALLSLLAILTLGLLSVSGVLDFANLTASSLLALAIIVGFTVGSTLRSAMLRGTGFVVLGQVPEFLVRPAVNLAALGGIWILADSPSGALALWGLVLANFVAYAIGSHILRLRVPIAIVTATEIAPNSRLWILSTLPFAAVSIAQVINQNIETIVLGFVANASEVGLYRVAFAGSLLAAFYLQALGITLAPKLAASWERNDVSAIRASLLKASVGGSIYSALVLLSALIVGRPLIQLFFGEEFVGAWIPLIVLLFGQVASSTVGPVGVALSMMGHARMVAWVLFCGVAANGAIAYFLGSEFGAVGAAIGSSVSMVLWNLGMMWFFIRLVRA